MDQETFFENREFFLELKSTDNCRVIPTIDGTRFTMYGISNIDPDFPPPNPHFFEEFTYRFEWAYGDDVYHINPDGKVTHGMKELSGEEASGIFVSIDGAIDYKQLQDN